jgi:FixJ family two-component response regulator
MTKQPGRVMVVDDEPHVREFLRDFLTSLRYEVAAFATGRQLLDAVPTFQPDVIVIDMRMPGLSGAEVLAALRRAGVTVPVILVSGNQLTVPEGVFDFVKKPFDLRTLAGVVSAAVDQGRTDDRGKETSP